MKIPTSVAFVLIGVVLLGAGAISYQQIQVVNGTAQSAPVPDGKAFHTEEEWTALQVAQFVADFAALTQTKNDGLKPVTIQKLPAVGNVGSYEIKWLKKKTTLSAASGIWNPETYQKWATELLPKPDSAKPGVSSLDCAKTLLDPSFKVLFAENQRISQFLNEHPASAEGHLQAALLTGTLALNDFAGRFRDTRIPLNRMTAHLAAADALGLPPADPARQLAEGIRLTLIGLQADALAAIMGWPKNLVLAEWGEILKLRITDDWREGRAAALAGSPALRNEYYRALVSAIGVTPGLEFLREVSGKPGIACWRIANEHGRSVSESHVITKPLLGIELEEIANAAKQFGVPVEKGSVRWLKDYLDVPEGSPVLPSPNGLQIEVAGRNLFGGYHQRHLMQAGRSLFAFLNDSWGVPEAARETADFLKSRLPDMRYKPFLLRINARGDAERKAGNIPCEAIITTNPEMVTTTLWANLRRDENGKEVMPAPDFHAWFHPEVPQGTAFYSGDRLYEIGVGDENDRPWLQTLWERAPYDYNLGMYNAIKENGSGENLSGPLLTKWIGPQVGVSLHATKRAALAYSGQPDLYEERMREAVAMDPDVNFTVGDYFAERGLDDKAAVWYLDGYKNAPDRVLMASKALWLIKYLIQKEDRATATKIAEEAREVYSYAGLSAYQWLMEKEGQWDEALETAVKTDERYNNGKPLCEMACLIRLNELSPEKAAAADFKDKISQTFPDGIQKVALSDFSGPPVNGVRIKENGSTLVPFALVKDMVIVALNGYRTDTFNQYTAIRALSDDPQMQFIVWDGSVYRLSEGMLPKRRFGVDMGDYKP